MTGNVVFLGFAVAGAPGFSLAASLAALAGFLVGAFAGGGLAERFGGHRGRLLRNAVAVEFVLVLVALFVIVPAGAVAGPVAAVVVAGLLAVAMGIQELGSPPARSAGPDHDGADYDADGDRRGRPAQRRIGNRSAQSAALALGAWCSWPVSAAVAPLHGKLTAPSDLWSLASARLSHVSGGWFETCPLDVVVDVPFLIPQLRDALIVAIIVAIFELVTLAWIRWRVFNTSFLRSFLCIFIGGAIIASISSALGGAAG